MENEYTTSNLQNNEKKQFFSYIRYNFFDNFMSQADMDSDNLLDESSLKSFQFFQMRFGNKWLVSWYVMSLVFSCIAAAFVLLPQTPFVRLISPLRGMAASYAVLGLSTLIVKHSKKWGMQYKKYRINKLYQKIVKMQYKNKKLEKAMDEEDIYAFEVEFKKMKKIHDKILTLYAEIEETASQLKMSTKNDKIRESVTELNNSLNRATSYFNDVQNRLKDLKKGEMSTNEEVLDNNFKNLSNNNEILDNNFKTSNNINKEQKIKDRKLEKENNFEDEEELVQ